ncbi:MAG: ATP-binding cassette domain-containing protein [Candidatus Omnitrophica bacterium]|nr:ATP-binding cassette domain-containing protein [Candidatus Omnitrophota bacterium]
MALISLQEISLDFGDHLIFDKLSMKIEAGERVALLGRNGSGKTTMMKVMAGEIEVNKGNVVYQKDLCLAYLPQEVPTGITGTVFDVVLSGLGPQVKLLSDYHHLMHRLQSEDSSELMDQISKLQDEIDSSGSWNLNNRVENVIGQMKIDPESDFEKLSGGQKRRALLARALVANPDVLMLDEPTNHLDIEAIDWLEGLLNGYKGTVFFITHDRTFMTRLATRIVELDRGKIMSWSCGYQVFLQRKQAALDNEEAYWANFDKKLAQEEIWIRRGVKARRCREEGRVKELLRLREEKSKQRKQMGLVRMSAQKSSVSGHRVIKVSNLGFSYGDTCLIRDFSAQVMRGDKIGVIGPNGSGKTTLLNILLGKLAPQKGKARQGASLEIAYYDQLREALDEERTVAENICEGNGEVIVNGKPRHIISYLQDFLFTPERGRTQVRLLSGGERNRLLLAKLFAKPSNLLVMDEPTNDLDIETLELLEELLLGYPGTLLLVSHDRAFLDNVVTSTIVLEGEGEINEYPGGYSDWIQQRKVKMIEISKSIEQKKTDLKEKDKKIMRKLTFNEKKEQEGIEEKIIKLEQEQQVLFSLLSDTETYRKNPEKIAEAKEKSENLKEEIVKAYARWEYFETFRDK